MVSMSSSMDSSTKVNNSARLMNQYTKLVGDSASTLEEDQAQADLDWASTTTLVTPVSHFEAAEVVFAKMFETDPQFVVAASNLLKHVGAEAFRRKCADLLTVLPVDLQDEQPSSAELLQDLKLFGSNAVKLLGHFEKALEKAPMRDRDKTLNKKDDAGTGHTVIIDVLEEDLRGSTISESEGLSTSAERQSIIITGSGPQSHVQDVSSMLKSKDHTAVHSDFILFVSESEAIRRFKSEIERQARFPREDIDEREAMPER
jgi:hypothetical protein